MAKKTNYTSLLNGIKEDTRKIRKAFGKPKKVKADTPSGVDMKEESEVDMPLTDMMFLLMNGFCAAMFGQKITQPKQLRQIANQMATNRKPEKTIFGGIFQIASEIEKQFKKDEDGSIANINNTFGELLKKIKEDKFTVSVKIADVDKKSFDNYKNLAKEILEDNDLEDLGDDIGDIKDLLESAMSKSGKENSAEAITLSVVAAGIKPEDIGKVSEITNANIQNTDDVITFLDKQKILNEKLQELDKGDNKEVYKDLKDQAEGMGEYLEAQDEQNKKLEAVGASSSKSEKAAKQIADGNKKTKEAITSKESRMSEGEAKEVSVSFQGIGRLILIASAVIILGALAGKYAMEHIADIMGFTMILAMVIIAIVGAYNLASRFATPAQAKLAESLVGLVKTAAWCVVIGALLAYFFPGYDKLAMHFVKVLSIMIFAVTAAFTLGTLGQGVKGAEEMAKLMKTAAWVVVIGALVGYLFPGYEQQAFQFITILAIMIFTVAAAFTLGSLGLGMKGAKDAISLMKVATAIVIIGSLVVHFMPDYVMNALLFTFTLAVFIFSVVGVYMLAGLLAKGALLSAKDVSHLIAVSAAILLVGALFILIGGLDFVIAALAFTALLALFIFSILMVYVLSSNMLKGALISATAVAILITVSAIILMIGALCIMLGGVKFVVSALAFVVLFVLFVGSILFALKLFLPDIAAVAPSMTPLVLLIAACAGILLLAGWIIQKNPWMVLTIPIFIALMGLFVFGIVQAARYMNKHIADISAAKKSAIDLAIIVGCIIGALTLIELYKRLAGGLLGVLADVAIFFGCIELLLLGMKMLKGRRPTLKEALLAAENLSLAVACIIGVLTLIDIYKKIAGGLLGVLADIGIFFAAVGLLLAGMSLLKGKRPQLKDIVEAAKNLSLAVACIIGVLTAITLYKKLAGGFLSVLKDVGTFALCVVGLWGALKILKGKHSQLKEIFKAAQNLALTVAVLIGALTLIDIYKRIAGGFLRILEDIGILALVIYGLMKLFKYMGDQKSTIEIGRETSIALGIAIGFLVGALFLIELFKRFCNNDYLVVLADVGILGLIVIETGVLFGIAGKFKEEIQNGGKAMQEAAIAYAMIAGICMIVEGIMALTGRTFVDILFDMSMITLIGFEMLALFGVVGKEKLHQVVERGAKTMEKAAIVYGIISAICMGVETVMALTGRTFVDILFDMSMITLIGFEMLALFGVVGKEKLSQVVERGTKTMEKAAIAYGIISAICMGVEMVMALTGRTFVDIIADMSMITLIGVEMAVLFGIIGIQPINAAVELGAATMFVAAIVYGLIATICMGVELVLKKTGRKYTDILNDMTAITGVAAEIAALFGIIGVPPIPLFVAIGAAAMVPAAIAYGIIGAICVMVEKMFKDTGRSSEQLLEDMAAITSVAEEIAIFFGVVGSPIFATLVTIGAIAMGKAASSLKEFAEALKELGDFVKHCDVDAVTDFLGNIKEKVFDKFPGPLEAAIITFKVKLIEPAFMSLSRIIRNIADSVGHMAQLMVPTEWNDEGKPIEFRQLNGRDFETCAKNIVDLTSTMTKGLLDAYDNNKDFFNPALIGDSVAEKIQTGSERLAQIISNIGQAVGDIASLMIPIDWNDQGQAIDFRQLNEKDFTLASDNVVQLITTLSDGLTKAYDAHPEFFDSDLFSDSIAQKVCDGSEKLGELIANIAHGVQAMASLTIPIEWDKNGKPIDFKVMTEKDLTDAANNTATVLGTIFNGLMKAYDENEDLFSGGGFLGMGDTPMAKISAAADGVSTLIAGLAGCIQSIANLMIPTEWNKENGTPIKFCQLEQKEFDQAVVNTGLIITTLFKALDIAAKDNKTLLADDNLKKVTEGVGQISQSIGGIADVIAKIASLQVPNDWNKKTGAPIGYKQLIEEDFVKASVNMGFIITFLVTMMSEIYNDPQYKTLWDNLSDDKGNKTEQTPVGVVTKAIGQIGKSIGGIADVISKLATMQVADVWDPQSGNPKHYRVLQETDFERASKGVDKIMTTLIDSMIDVYDNHQEDFGEDSKVQQVIKSIKGLNEPIAGIVDTIIKLATCQIEYEGEDGKTHKKQLSETDIESAKGNLKNIISFMFTTFNDIYQEWGPNAGAGKLVFFTSNGISPELTSMEKATKTVVGLIGEVSEIITGFAGNTVPLFDSNGQKKGEKPVNYDEVTQNIKKLTTCIFETVNDSYNILNAQGLLDEDAAYITGLVTTADKVKEIIKTFTDIIVGLYSLKIVKELDSEGNPKSYMQLNEKVITDALKNIDTIISSIPKTLNNIFEGLSGSMMFISMGEQLIKNITKIVVLIPGFVEPIINSITPIYNNTDMLKAMADGNIYEIFEHALKGIDNILLYITKSDLINHLEDIYDERKTLVQGLTALKDVFEAFGKIYTSLPTDDTDSFINLFTNLDNIITSFCNSYHMLYSSFGTNTSFAAKAGNAIIGGVKEFFTGESNDVDTDDFNSKLAAFNESLGMIIQTIQLTENVNTKSFEKIVASLTDLTQSMNGATNAANVFKDQNTQLERFIKITKNINIKNLNSLNNFVRGMNELSRRMGNLDKLTDAIANKLSIALQKLTKELTIAKKTIDKAEELQADRHKKIDESITKIQTLMAQEMSINVVASIDQSQAQAQTAATEAPTSAAPTTKKPK